ncbi:hypothetical protein FPZ42_07740 [Mucilaginibacter achroorhodeus]|uniref:Uncharacterized protein n=1 Tax=Mucilaginibacter achroorhodeus TaxID=2599294 RepID=A0A563U6E8_9SPHI|nr:hypothetical protein [Mucilaginibacter achroorhodeus]TWR26918.1 hypothetical protein FPZ42_07740 [Mucilaginibacter achroorhodeus]
MNNENEALKNKIIIELYNTGRIDKRYFGQLSKSTKPANQLKKYIEIQLFKNMMYKPDSEYLDDCYQELFLHLYKIPTDRFIELYNLGNNVLMSYILRIIVLRLFSVDKRTMNPNHSFAKALNFTSVFNRNNAMINHIEVMSDEPDFNTNENVLVIYDSQETIDAFESDYGFSVEELFDHMTPEQRFVFYKLTEGCALVEPFQKKKGRKSLEEIAVKNELFRDVNELRTFITNKNEALRKEYK